MFDDSFVNELPEDPLLATKEICEHFFKFHNYTISRGLTNANEEYLKAYGLLELYLLEHDEELKEFFYFEHLEITGSNTKNIINYFKDIHNKILTIYNKKIISKHKSRYSIELGKLFSYEFSESDHDRVQQIVNELRDLISKSNYFEEDHQARLLKRVESLQSELHKKMSNLDRFWGLVGDAGVVAGKFGKDAKPLVDIIRELAEIVWRTQAKSEGLSGKLSLPFTDNNQLEE
jgi:hypothetical protein